MSRCSTPLPSLSVCHHPLMSEDSSSFELVDSPVMVFPANMTSTPEKPVQPNTDQQPEPAEDFTATSRHYLTKIPPNIEEVKGWGRAEEPGKEKLNCREKPEEPVLDQMENRLKDKLMKKKMEDRNRDNGGWRLMAPWEISWREHTFVALQGLADCVLVLAGISVLLRG